MSVTQAAAMLNIGRTAAYNAVRRGEIETLRVSGRARVPRAVIDELLGRKDPSAGPPASEIAEEVVGLLLAELKNALLERLVLVERTTTHPPAPASTSRQTSPESLRQAEDA
jgi:excisionase family DNA binding protein